MSLRYFGYLLIAVGFLGGSFEVVKQVEKARVIIS